MQDVDKCSHEQCLCPTKDESGYCSTICQTAAEQDLTTLKCECGHPACEA